jgi:hypothetical protein
VVRPWRSAEHCGQQQQQQLAAHHTTADRSRQQ